MPRLPSLLDKLLALLVVLLSLGALALTVLGPGFASDNTRVYQGF